MKSAVVAGWLQMYTERRCFCGGWKKYYCVMTNTNDFMIFSSNKPNASLIFTGTSNTFIDAYESSSDNLPSVFIVLFVGKRIHLRAESDVVRDIWINYLKPPASKEFMLKESDDSTDCISTHEYIEKSTGFWQQDISKERQHDAFKSLMNYKLIENLKDYKGSKLMKYRALNDKVGNREDVVISIRKLSS